MLFSTLLRERAVDCLVIVLAAIDANVVRAWLGFPLGWWWRPLGWVHRLFVSPILAVENQGWLGLHFANDLTKSCE